MWSQLHVLQGIVQTSVLFVSIRMQKRWLVRIARLCQMMLGISCSVGRIAGRWVSILGVRSPTLQETKLCSRTVYVSIAFLTYPCFHMSARRRNSDSLLNTFCYRIAGSDPKSTRHKICTNIISSHANQRPSCSSLAVRT